MKIQFDEVTFENKKDEINVVHDGLFVFGITPEQLVNIAMMLENEIEKEKFIGINATTNQNDKIAAECSNCKYEIQYKDLKPCLYCSGYSRWESE